MIKKRFLLALILFPILSMAQNRAVNYAQRSSFDKSMTVLTFLFTGDSLTNFLRNGHSMTIKGVIVKKGLKYLAFGKDLWLRLDDEGGLVMDKWERYQYYPAWTGFVSKDIQSNYTLMKQSDAEDLFEKLLE